MPPGDIISLCLRLLSQMYRACCQVWESADTSRLGFKLHTVLGGEGRRVEVPRHSVRLLSSRAVQSTSLIPIYVAGLDRNIVLDRAGTFFENERLMRILEQSSNESTDAKLLRELDSKENRTNWRHSVSRKRKSS